MSRCFYLKTHARLIARLRAARISRSPRKEKAAVRDYLGSKAAWHAIADRVLDDRPGEPRDEREARVAALASRVEPFRPCREPVRWWRVEKKRSGEYRVICDLPPVLRLRHLMIREVLSVLFRPHGHIFDIKGVGRDRLARSVKAAMEEGFTHAYVGDVRNCFPSVNPDAFELLPLPKQVIRYALDYRNLHFRHDIVKERAMCLPLGHGIPFQGLDGPSGNLQGSPTANLILAWLLNDMDEHLSSSCRLFLLSDNIIVLARSERACRRIDLTLTRYFREHQAGPFVLEGEIRSTQVGFDTLGYNFRLDKSTGEACIDFTDTHAARIIRRMDCAIREDKAAGRVEPDRALKVLHGMRSGFRAATCLEGMFMMGLEYAQNELLEHAGLPMEVGQ